MTLRRGRGVGVGARRGSGGTMMGGGAMAGDMMIEIGIGIGTETGMMAVGMEEMAVAMTDIDADNWINGVQRQAILASGRRLCSYSIRA